MNKKIKLIERVIAPVIRNSSARRKTRSSRAAEEALRVARALETENEYLRNMLTFWYERLKSKAASENQDCNLLCLDGCNDAYQCDTYQSSVITKSIVENQTCRVCGCTWFTPCKDGCYWVKDDLCSSCRDQESVAAGFKKRHPGHNRKRKKIQPGPKRPADHGNV